ncbi:MAG: hypothetical protein WCE82_08795 [Halobacteriota archaeon]
MARLEMASDSLYAENQKQAAVKWLKKHIVGVCIVVEAALIMLLFNPALRVNPASLWWGIFVILTAWAMVFVFVIGVFLFLQKRNQQAQ